MRFSVYKNSLFFGLQQVTNYRSEVWLSIVYKGVYLLGIVFLWSIIGKSGGAVEGVNSLVSYFLIASGVQGLVDGEGLRFSKAINQEVKNGGLNSHLLKPMNPILFIYSAFLGTRGVVTIMALVLMLAGFAYLPSLGFWQVVLFLLSLVMAFLMGFIFNLFVGSMSFWTPEAGHLQNVFSHILKVFSGVLIPISYFSGATKTFLILSPFPVLAYLPSSVLQSSVIDSEKIIILLSSVFWIVVLLPLSLWFWRRGLKRYEAVGI